MAPSAIAPVGKAFTQEGFKDFLTPRALETDEIAGIVADYAHAAGCAKRAGFDGVEIHAANGYLLDQFIRDSTNKRSDRYGGSIENRARIVSEVAEAVTAVWGGGQSVGVRLSPITPQVGEIGIDSTVMGTYSHVVRELDRFGLVYMHLIEGVTQGDRTEPGGYSSQALRRLFRGLYMANNGIDREMALRMRRDGEAELVCFGRPFISNPDLVERLRTGAPIEESDKATWYGGDGHGYTDYPALAQAAE